MKKEIYVKPQMEIFLFDSEDVITTSNPKPSDPNEAAIIMSKAAGRDDIQSSL